MASKLQKAPLLRLFMSRGLSQLAPVSGNPNYELKTTILSNKLTVVCADNESSLVRVSVIFRAGSRYESSDNLGVTHVLRTAAGLSTKNASQFAIIRNIQQVGANLTATSDRETISYTLEGTRQAVEKVLPFLTEVATQQIFKPWEVSDITSRLQLDIATRSLPLRAIDLLHNAAFRTGLGNSMFIPKSQIGKISSETLQHYVASNFLSGRAAVIGFGIDQSELIHYAQTLNIESGEGCNNSSSYKGGELRSNKGGDVAFVTVAGEGASLKDPKEALAFAILQKAIGVGPQVKWGNNNGIFSRVVGIGEHTSSAINVSYSDTGLFGILIGTPAKSAGKLVESAVKLLRSGSVSDEDVNRGKKQLKSSLLLEAESGADAVRDIASQSVLTGNPQTASQIVAAVDSICTSDVRDALRNAGRKITLASIGNLSNVPYLDELK
ncbi:ubiquinol-cytochrome c reductase core protein 2 [Leptinotarsa decemlineata]|uniref:ubiquinol-cytochrome c reductase core protein 2 n=1 Tax=Leptinotarsa decemlineata TaxID=7539 RepID=UPI003D30B84E